MVPVLFQSIVYSFSGSLDEAIVFPLEHVVKGSAAEEYLLHLTFFLNLISAKIYVSKGVLIAPSSSSCFRRHCLSMCIIHVHSYVECCKKSPISLILCHQKIKETKTTVLSKHL
jgi:hypothetical protein